MKLSSKESKELWLGAVFSMIPTPDQAYPPLGIISCVCSSSQEAKKEKVDGWHDVAVSIFWAWVCCILLGFQVFLRNFEAVFQRTLAWSCLLNDSSPRSGLSPPLGIISCACCSSQEAKKEKVDGWHDVAVSIFWAWVCCILLGVCGWLWLVFRCA